MEMGERLFLNSELIAYCHKNVKKDIKSCERLFYYINSNFQFTLRSIHILNPLNPLYKYDEKSSSCVLSVLNLLTTLISSPVKKN